MEEVRFVITGPEGLAPYVDGLRELERSILYPIADGADQFFIDHGPEYHPFFSRQGRARFLLALRADRVVGSMTGVERPIQVAGQTLRAGYLCDLKLAAPERGRGLAGRMIRHGFRHILLDGTFWRTQFIFGAAMRGASGDVMRATRGAHPFKLASVSARLQLFFASANALSTLDLSQAPAPPESPGALLGTAEAYEGTDICSTAGRKDLRLVSTGSPWRLLHLPKGPGAWTPSWGAYLRRCGERIIKEGFAGDVCFAMDERLQDHLTWLAAQGIKPGAVCTVYALHLGLSRRAAWVHLPTSEI
jgi:hypothetical protein